MSLHAEIIARTKADLRARKEATPLTELQRMIADADRPRRSLYDALCARPFSIVAEIKRCSPSRGRMDPRNVDSACRVYQQAESVAGISVLTNGPYFDMSVDDLARIRQETNKPLLRKDFIVDEYQVWEAKAFGADAILLMANSELHQEGELSHAPMTELLALADSLDLEVVFEIGMSAVRRGDVIGGSIDEADKHEHVIWGVNSRVFETSPGKFRYRLTRSLQWFRSFDGTTDLARHRELQARIPKGRPAIAESGIQNAQDLLDVPERYQAALVGTAFLQGPRSVAEVMSEFEVALANRARHGSTPSREAASLRQPPYGRPRSATA